MGVTHLARYHSPSNKRTACLIALLFVCFGLLIFALSVPANATSSSKAAVSAAQSDYDQTKAAADKAKEEMGKAKAAADNAAADVSDAQARADAADKAAADASDPNAVSNAQTVLDKAKADKAKSDKNASDAAAALDKAKGATATAQSNVDAKQSAETNAAAAVDSAQTAYDQSVANDAKNVMSVHDFLDSISDGNYSTWAAQTYHSLADSTKTGKADGSNLTYKNFLKALDNIDDINAYRTEHNLPALTVSGMLMAGQMLECDLVDGTDDIGYHTNFWGGASEKDICWGYSNPDTGWLGEKDVFKRDAWDFAASGTASDEFKSALNALDWNDEAAVQEFVGTYESDINAYVESKTGSTHVYGHWASLCSPTNTYIGEGFNYGGTTGYYRNTATAGLSTSKRYSSDITGTTDYFRDLVKKAQTPPVSAETKKCAAALASAQTNKEKADTELADAKEALKNARNAQTSAQLAYDADKAKADAAKADVDKAQRAYDTAVSNAQHADELAGEARAAHTALDNAKSAKAEADAVLDDAKAAYSDAQTAVSEAKSKLDAAEQAFAAEKKAGAAKEEAAVDKRVASLKTDADPKGSTFSLLQARTKAVGKSYLKLTWAKVSGAKKYVIYGNKCGKGKKYAKLSSTTSTSYTQKKLKKGIYYKYLVVAIRADGKALSTSKTIHAATSGGKAGNCKAVKITNAKKATCLKKDKTVKLYVKQVAQSKKLKIKKHRAILFESSNAKVVSVSKSGKIKAKKKGTAYLYAYAQNGVYAKLKVTVK